VSLPSWQVTRDDAGRIVTKTELLAGTSTAEYSYAYDSLGRLVTVTKDGTTVEEYQYAPDGTRTSEKNLLRGIASRTMTYSDEDHLLTAGSTTYEYDLDGFLTTRTNGANITRYQYSARGELLGVTFPSGTIIEYLHDPVGRRIAKKVNGTITEKYLWQGMTRLLAVYDGSNNLLMRFQYADARMPLAMTSGGSTYYLTYDQVGSLRLITDAAGNIVKRLTYDSFGNILSDSNPSFKIPFAFAGGFHDPDTNLVRFGYRDYDPDVGRWLAKDPIGFNIVSHGKVAIGTYPGVAGKSSFAAGGYVGNVGRTMETIGVGRASIDVLRLGQLDTNLYGYVLNDPVNFIDPLGLATDYSEKGAMCAEAMRQRISSGSCPTEEDCFICCVDLIGSGEYTPIAICEAFCAAGLKAIKGKEGE
jgi:RHS repeat-associated protein